MHIEAINLTSHPLPVPATPRSAGLDLKATEYALIPAGGRALIKTGIKLAIPDGFAGLICPRSGLALKHGVTVLNAPGVLGQHVGLASRAEMVKLLEGAK